jgi:hypothetical protein
LALLLQWRSKTGQHCCSSPRTVQHRSLFAVIGILTSRTFQPSAVEILKRDVEERAFESAAALNRRQKQTRPKSCLVTSARMRTAEDIGSEQSALAERKERHRK